MNLLVALMKKEWTQERIRKTEEMGYTVRFFRPYETGITEEEKQWAEVLSAGRLFLKDVDLGEFPNLKYVQCMSSGLNGIKFEPLRKKNIRFANGRGLTNVTISEFVMLKILEGCKRAQYLYEQQQTGQFNVRHDLWELCGKTAAVIGGGAIGSEVMKRLKVFGVNVIAVDVVPLKNENIDKWYHIDDIDEALGQSDIVVLSLPLLKSTYHMLNKDRIRAMKDDSILINVARGGLIDQDALVEAVKAGKFRHVGLDVVEEEPLSGDNPLVHLDRVFVTPHNAYETDQNDVHYDELLSENLRRFRDGEALVNEIDISKDIDC